MLLYSLFSMYVGVSSVVATGTSQGVSDQSLPHHGSSSSLASSACSIQSGCTDKTVDNLSMKEGRCDSMILDGRYVIIILVLRLHCHVHLVSMTAELYTFQCWNWPCRLWAVRIAGSIFRMVVEKGN